MGKRLVSLLDSAISGGSIPPNVFLGRKSVQTAGQISLSTGVITKDNSQPLFITETQQVPIFAFSYIPKSITSTLIIRFDGIGSATTSGVLCLYVNDTGSDTPATATTYLYPVGTTNEFFPILLVYQYEPGTTDAQTFKMGAGTVGAGTFYINRSNSTFFGGSMHSILSVTEIEE